MAAPSVPSVPPVRRAIRAACGRLLAAALATTAIVAAAPAVAQAPAPAGVLDPLPSAPPAAVPRQRSGTGFVVGTDGRVLTNAHVVAGCTRVEVAYADGGRARGRVGARDTRADLAIIEDLAARPAVAAFGRAARAGDDVVALGYPLRGLLAMDVNVSTGIVSALAGLRDDPTRLQISAPVQSGNSGGPLLDETGAVVGVVVSKLNALRVARLTGDVPQNINFAVKGEVAQGFLRAQGVVPVAAPPDAPRRRTADIVQAARAFTVLLECEPEREAVANGPAPVGLGAPPPLPVPPAAPPPSSAPPPATAGAAPDASRTAVLGMLDPAEAAGGPRLSLPLRCTPGVECALLDHVDHGGARDYACGTRAVARSVFTRFAPLGDRLARHDLPVVAAADGRVVSRADAGVVIDHGDGWRTVYRFDPRTVAVAVGATVRRGDVLGTVGPYPWGGGTPAALMGFAVLKDGRAIDPFRPGGAVAGACGTPEHARWTPEALAALEYRPSAVLDAGFVARDVDLAAVQAGDLAPVTRESTHIGFWVRRAGIRPGDRETVRIVPPAGAAVAQHVFEQTTHRPSGVLQVSMRSPGGGWPAGTYRASYSLLRDGTEAVLLERELVLR